MTTTRIAATALTAGPVLYLAAEGITALGWRGSSYSYLHNWISDLGVPDPGVFHGRAINSPLHDVMNTGLMVAGIALVIGLVLLSHTLPTRIGRSTRALAVATGVGYALVGLTHTSTAAAANGTLTLHFLGAFLAILGGNTLALTLGIHWWRSPNSLDTRRLGHASASLGVLGLTAAAALGLTATSTTAPNGLIERIAVYTVTLWQLRTALHLATHGQSRAPQVADQTPAHNPSGPAAGSAQPAEPLQPAGCPAT